MDVPDAWRAGPAWEGSDPHTLWMGAPDTHLGAWGSDWIRAVPAPRGRPTEACHVLVRRAGAANTATSVPWAHPSDAPAPGPSAFARRAAWWMGRQAPATQEGLITALWTLALLSAVRDPRSHFRTAVHSTGPAPGLQEGAAARFAAAPLVAAVLEAVDSAHRPLVPPGERLLRGAWDTTLVNILRLGQARYGWVLTDDPDGLRAALLLGMADAHHPVARSGKVVAAACLEEWVARDPRLSWWPTPDLEALRRWWALTPPDDLITIAPDPHSVFSPAVGRLQATLDRCVLQRESGRLPATAAPPHRM